MIIGGNGDSVYSRLMAAVGHPEMGSDNPKYANNTKRCAAEDEIYKVLPATSVCWVWWLDSRQQPSKLEMHMGTMTLWLCDD